MKAPLGILLLALLAASCQSASDLRRQPLPFRVVVAPLDSEEVALTLEPEGIPFEPNPAWRRALREALRERLDEQVFVRADRLEDVAGPLAQSGGSQGWFELARESTDADLLIQFRLRRGARFEGEQNPHILAAAPLCWIPGPHLWFIPDQRYTGNCTLTVEVYDLKRCALEEPAMVGRRRWYFSHAVIQGKLYLNFFERAGWDLYIYPVAIVWPTLYLPYERDDLAELLMEESIEELASSLVNDLSLRRFDLVRNEPDYSFYLDDLATRVEPIDDSRVRVDLTLAHRVGSSRNEPEAISIWADDLPEPPEPRLIDWKERAAAHVAGSNASGYARYELSEIVEVSPESEYLRLRVVSGWSPAVERDFSLRLPGADRGSE